MRAQGRAASFVLGCVEEEREGEKACFLPPELGRHASLMSLQPHGHEGTHSFRSVDPSFSSAQSDGLGPIL